MSKVISIEKKDDKNGNPMKITTFDNGAKVYVNSKYDEPIYEQVVDGSEWELTKDGNFDKIKYDKPAPKGNGGAGIAKAQERKAEYIATAQDAKQTAIQMSSTFRDATLITIAQFSGRSFLETEFKAKWQEWREWLNANFDNSQPF